MPRIRAAMGAISLMLLPAWGLLAQSPLPRYGSEEDSLAAASPAEHAIVEELRLRRALVDFDRANGSLYELRYARLGVPDPSGGCLAPTDSVAMVSSLAWPENTYARLVVLADGGADIYMLEEVQRDCDGYTQTTFRLYFDEDRSTRVFVRHFSFLDGCPAIPAHEVTSYYYGPDQSLIAKEYVLADPRARRLSASACRAFPPREAYVIEPSWDAAVRTRLRGLRFIPG